MNEVCHSDEEQTGNGPGQRPAQGSKSQSILNIQGDTIVKNLNCRKKPEWVPVSQCQKTQKETLQVRETLFFSSRKHFKSEWGTLRKSRNAEKIPKGDPLVSLFLQA